MPHKCVKCGSVYPNTSEELMKGCSCTSRIFLYMRDEQVSVKEQAEMFERQERHVFESNRERIEEIAEIAPVSIEKIGDTFAPLPAQGSGLSSASISAPKLGVEGVRTGIVSEAREKDEAFAGEMAQVREAKLEPASDIDGQPPVENITILEKGSYMLDINSLMAGNPLVIRSEAGVFFIRIPSTAKHAAKARG